MRLLYRVFPDIYRWCFRLSRWNYIKFYQTYIYMMLLVEQMRLYRVLPDIVIFIGSKQCHFDYQFDAKNIISKQLSTNAHNFRSAVPSNPHLRQWATWRALCHRQMLCLFKCWYKQHARHVEPARLASFHKMPTIRKVISRDVSSCSLCKRVIMQAVNELVLPASGIDHSAKFHNALVPYSTIHHSEQKCTHFCSEWCAVRYGPSTLWVRLAYCVHIESTLQWRHMSFKAS